MRFRVLYKQEGKLKEETFRAKNKEALLIRLKKSHKLCLECTPIESFYEKLSRLRKPTTKELLSIFYQLSLGVRAKLSFKEVLAQSKTQNPILKIQLQKALNAINQGKSLGECFRLAGFEEFICAMIEIGDKGGRLSEALGLVIEGLKKRNQNQKVLKKILLYPLFVAVMMIFVFWGITFFVLPQFEALFLTFEGKLPLATQSLLFMRWILEDYGIFIVLFLGMVLGILSVSYQKSQHLQQIIAQFILKLPMLGKVLYYHQINQFLLTFYWLYQSGVSLEVTLKTATKAVENAFLKERLQGIGLSIKQGLSLAEAFEKSKVWDSLSLQLLYGAKDGEGFLESLGVILEFYQEGLQIQSERILGLLEPFMIVCLGGLILWLALGVFLPLWELPLQMSY